MGEEPKSIWKKLRRGFRVWLILAAAAFFTFAITDSLTADWDGLGDWLLKLALNFGASLIFASALVGLWIFAPWFWNFTCWFVRRFFKRLFFVCACLAVLIALFYAEEDWRGWHAWNKFKQEWEAKGEKFDWQSFVAPPVPDDQNFAMAPIFDITDKLLSAEWRRQHRNPRYNTHSGLSSDDGETEWDTNLVDRLDMNVCGRLDGYYEKEPKINGDWAKGTFTDLKPWQAYYRAPAQTNDYWTAKTNVYAVSPQPQSPAADVLLALSKYDSVIEELRQASRRPYSRFPVAYEQDNKSDIPFFHLTPLENCSQVLQLRALAELQDGQSEKALADVELSLYLVNSIRTEPFLISHLVRAAMWKISLQPIYEGLAEHKWSDAQLAGLGGELAKFDFLADCQLALRGQLGELDSYIEHLPHHPEWFFSEYMSLWQRIGFQLFPNGWFYQNRLNLDRTMVEYYLPVVDANEHTFSVKLLSRAEAVMADHEKHDTLFNILEDMLLPATGPYERSLAYVQSSADLARVAVALERYQLAHGEFPDSLDALAPQFLEKIPHDIIGGQPLHYRRTDDGQFVLYSVGWNETDDGGVVSFRESGSVDTDKGDWVWRYPKGE